SYGGNPPYSIARTNWPAASGSRPTSHSRQYAIPCSSPRKLPASPMPWIPASVSTRTSRIVQSRSMAPTPCVSRPVSCIVRMSVIFIARRRSAGRQVDAVDEVQHLRARRVAPGLTRQVLGRRQPLERNGEDRVERLGVLRRPAHLER